MKKVILMMAVVGLAFSSFAGNGNIGSVVSTVPEDIKVVCKLISNKGIESQETLNFQYGSGQKNLTIKGAEKITVMVSDNNALEAGLHDLKLFLKDSIVSAKSITVSEDQTHGVHVLLLSKSSEASSIFCGL